MVKNHKFKLFEEFISESLSILTLKDTMKNEFMRNINLKNDFENAKREFYVNGNFILTHMTSDIFEARGLKIYDSSEFDKLLRENVNTVTERMKFRRYGKPSIDKLKEQIWMLKAELE